MGRTSCPPDPSFLAPFQQPRPRSPARISLQGFAQSQLSSSRARAAVAGAICSVIDKWSVMFGCRWSGRERGEGTAGSRKEETKAWQGQDLTAPSPWPCFLQIVRLDRSMEQIIFPVPGICEFLTKETKYRLFTTTEQDEQGSKVSDFFDQSSFLHNEMEWQKKLRSKSKADLPFGLPPASTGASSSPRCENGGQPCFERVPGSSLEMRSPSSLCPLLCRAQHTRQFADSGGSSRSQGCISSMPVSAVAQPSEIHLAAHSLGLHLQVFSPGKPSLPLLSAAFS